MGARFSSQLWDANFGTLALGLEFGTQALGLEFGTQALGLEFGTWGLGCSARVERGVGLFPSDAPGHLGRRRLLRLMRVLLLHLPPLHCTLFEVLLPSGHPLRYLNLFRRSQIGRAHV